MPRPSLGAAPDSAREIHVLFCCNPGYFQHLATAIASLLRHNSQHRLVIHLAVSAHEAAGEATLRSWVGERATLRIYGFDWGRVRWPTAFHISQDTYIRLFAPGFLPPQLNKVLYLDADLLVLDDLAPLWDTDISGCALAAVPDPFGAGRTRELGLPREATYVNAGVLLMNLAAWRAAQLTERLSVFIESSGERLLFHDQDALNAVLHDRIGILDVRWNLQAKTLRLPRGARIPHAQAHRRAAAAPGILHYASSRKPWLFAAAVPRKRLYRRYLRETPWRDARPVGRSLAAAPELVINHLMLALRLDYDWERLRRATLIGRAIDRLLSGLVSLGRRRGRQKIEPARP